MGKFNYSTKLSIPTPKLTIKKDDTEKMKAAMRKALVKGTQKGSTYVNQALRAALNNAMESSVWGWSGKVTMRMNGQTAGTPRDIVDTGRLKNSLKIKESFAQTKTTFSISYSAPYAALVHYGGVIQPYGNSRAATVILPGRPWVSATLNGTHGIERFNWSDAYSKGINEAWTAQFG